MNIIKHKKTALKTLISTLEKDTPKNLNDVIEYDTLINNYLQEIKELKNDLRYQLNMDYSIFVISKIYYQFKNNCLINYEQALKTILEIVTIIL